MATLRDACVRNSAEAGPFRNRTIPLPTPTPFDMYRFLFALLLAAPVAAQDFPGVELRSPFLLPSLPVSTHEAGIEQALVAGPSDNPYAFRHNPALLADAAERPAFRFSATAAQDLFGVDDLMIGSSAASIGIDAGEIAGGSVQIGLGGGYAEYRDAEILITDDRGLSLGEYASQEREIAGGLALGWNGALNVRVGATAFRRESLEESRSASLTRDRDRVTTLDVGGAVTLPLLRGPNAPGETALALDLTGAYVYRGVTTLEDDRATFIGGPNALPPEVQTVGGSARLAIIRQLGRRGTFRLLDADVRAQTYASDDLPDETRFGATVVLAEVIALRAGQSDSGDAGTGVRQSVGAELRLGGLIRAIGAAQESASMLALADRLTTRFEVALFDVGEAAETPYYGFTFGWRP